MDSVDQDGRFAKVDVEGLIEEVISLRKSNKLLCEILKKEGRSVDATTESGCNRSGESSNKLTNHEILRYSRQLLVPEISVEGQENLKRSSVIVVGAGGLGCPVLMYLAAGGVGKLGIIDGDIVEMANLHRQIIHEESSIGLPKALSAKVAVNRISSSCECIAYQTILTEQNAIKILHGYDVIVDASDNVATRYLVNDAAVILGKPLVAACVLRAQGQLTVYNFGNGPCYRCLYPTPPLPDTVANCGDGGVINAVPGVLGSLQALEAIKLCSRNTTSYSGKLLTFDGASGKFDVLKLRSKRDNCDVCGINPKIRTLIDYTEFCHAGYSDKCQNLHLLPPELRITPKEYSEILSKDEPHLLVDVREKLEFEICKLNKSINIPFHSLEKNIGVIASVLKDVASQRAREVNSIPIYFVCRRGNQSQRALEKVKCLIESEKAGFGPNPLKDISGGLQGWATSVDPNFPIY